MASFRAGSNQRTIFLFTNWCEKQLRDSLLHPGKGLMKGLPHRRGVSIGQACTLDEQDVDVLLHRVDPTLRTMSTAMAEGSWAERAGDTRGRHHNMKAEPHAHAIGEARLQIARVILRH